MHFSKTELIIIAVIFLAFMGESVSLSFRHKSDLEEIRKLQESNGLYNIQMAEMKLDNFLHGKDQNFETGRQIVFHLEEAVKYRADQLDIGKVATKLDLFASNNMQSNKTAKEISEDTKLFPKIIRFEHVIY